MAERLIKRELIRRLNLHEADKELLDLVRSIDWHNPSSIDDRYVFAKEIVRQAEDLVSLVDPTSLLLNQKTYDPGVTSVKFKNVVGFEARAVTSGGYKEAVRVDNEIISYPIPRRYDHVTLEFLKEDLEQSTYEDIGAIRAGIAEALLRKKINTVWAACSGAIMSGDTNYMEIAGSALTESAVNDGINYVDSYGGGVNAIVGHPAKVNGIASFTNFQTIMPEQLKVDYWRSGFIGLYRGANVVKLPSVADDKYGIAPTDANSVYIVGAGLGEIAQIRGLRADTWDDPQRDVQYISAQHKYVVITWQPQGAYRIKLTG